MVGTTSKRTRRPGFLRDTRGAAAAELVLWVAVMLVPIMSVIDVGFYVFQRMQVELAAQAGAQAIRQECDDAVTPLTGNCANVASVATTAAQSTLLGSDVSVASGYPSEAYYCVNASNTLVLVGTAGTTSTAPTKPGSNDCTAVVGSNTRAPLLYARVGVSKSFTPVFSGVSVASLLSSPITATAFLRVE